jgi:putative transcriptional regulator
MISKVHHHPTDEMLTDFTAGNLGTGLSVVISAHIELCEQCRHRRTDLENQSAALWEQEASMDYQGVTGDFGPMLAEIHSKLDGVSQETSVHTQPAVLSEMHMLEGSVRLPKVLAKLAGEGLVWKKLSGGINQASIKLDDETTCEFLYMKPGSQAPIHTHRGNEFTLVLDGSFSDELGNYKPADFLSRDPSHHHQPRSDEGCLCFAVQDGPLKFTRGLARLLNPILGYRFKQVLSRVR